MSILEEVERSLVAAAERRAWRRHPSPRLALAVAGVAAALVAVVLIAPARRAPHELAAGTPAAGADAHPRPSFTPPPTPPRAPLPFSVFHRPARPRDRQHLLKGLDTRRIASTPSADVFLGVHADKLCLIVRHRSNGSSGCGPIDAYRDGTRLIASYSDDDGPSTFALAAPDGVRSVRLTLADGSVGSYPIRTNGFARDVPTRVVLVEWRAPDGTSQRMAFAHAPAFRAQDFYAAFQRPATPADALDGLPDARLIAEAGDARAWLVPRLGAVCLVVRVGAAQGSGCRQRVADVHTPLVVGVPVAGSRRVVAAAFARQSSGISLTPAATTRTSDALLTLTGAGAQLLRYRNPARERGSDTFPAGAGAFTLHARPEPPTAIAAQ